MSAYSLAPIAPVSVVDQVTVQIRRSIVRGELPAGDRFSITDLASRLGVSHIPIREALRRLESEGLVNIRPARGAEVRPMNAADLDGIYGLRTVIEPPLAARGAVLLNDEEIEELFSLLTVYHRGVDLDDELAAHEAFHLGIMKPAASEWDLRVLNHLWAANERYARLMFDPSDEGRQSELHEAHRNLAEAVAARSTERVEAAVADHLEGNWSAIRGMLDRHGDPATDEDSEEVASVS